MDALRQYGLFVVAALVAAGGFAAQPGWDMAFWLSGALLACAGVILKDARKGALVTAVVALGSNAYLFSHKLDAAAGPSRCNINQVINCDLVNASAASEMFGLPITLFGAGFYAGLALAAMLQPRNTPRFHQLSGLFALVNLGISAWLAWESKKIGAVCIVCISIYAANGLLLWAALKGLADEGKKLTDDLAGVPMSWTSLILAATFGMVVMVGAGQWRQVKPSGPSVANHDGGRKEVDPQDPAQLAQLYSLPRGPLQLDGTEPMLGDPNAPYQIVEFADFGCPHCAQAFQQVHQLMNESKDFNLRFKVFPLTAACNPGLERDSGSQRCRAAQAAECANKQGKFWEMSNLIFANQAYMEDKDLAFMATQVDLDMDAWNECMLDPEVAEGIVADAKAGLAVGVMGTPTFLMKGTHGDKWIDVAQGVTAAYVLVEAQKNGVVLQEPGPPRMP